MLVGKLCKPILKFVHVIQKLLRQNCIDRKFHNERRINCQNTAKKKVDFAGERPTPDSTGNASNRRLTRRQNKDFVVSHVEKADLNASFRAPLRHKTAKSAVIKKKSYTKTSNDTSKSISEHNPKKISRDVQTGIKSRDNKSRKKLRTGSAIKKKRKYKKRKRDSESTNKKTKTINVNKRHKINKSKRKCFIDDIKLSRIRARNYDRKPDPSNGLKKKATNYSPLFVFDQICMIIDIVMPHFVLSAVEQSFAKTDLANNQVRNYVNDYIHDAKKGFKEMIFYYLCNSQEDVWREKLNQIWHCLKMCKFYILRSDGTKKKSTNVKNYVKVNAKIAPAKKKKAYKFVPKASYVKSCLPLQEAGRSTSDITMENVSSFVPKECRVDAKVMYVKPKTK
ncbi:uncharacterized protein LOC106669490 [Cimex lectularius]|uniref:Uncharacterized protein n=1 Tax=Cimex lectularius TaxID=79782 RepID=A0A8I6RY30_CIMLE|nr:uncharacterized protein LOC106669490 [Cimex lectularius]